ncbi:hypothetical protein GU926_08335 [Nibribacter ruber]|uniref:Uncharacterized protein n=1 Tax=Nibribacter ruber TaxID=2698458 RepID=A0A6P1NYH9_9BACT|nr:hypothetical protein [Nibribacter ruber]QHL87444.1 hypothetical protein GU926_08335 [Nibribacter ruber]
MLKFFKDAYPCLRSGGTHYYKQTLSNTIHVLKKPGQGLINVLDTKDIVNYLDKPVTEIEEQEFTQAAGNVLADLTLAI